MKKFFTITLVSLLFSAATFANIIINDREDNGTTTYIVTASQDDGMLLYNSLMLAEQNGRSGLARVFRTADGILEIYSTMSKIPGNPAPFVSTITVKYLEIAQRVKATTRVFQGENHLSVYLINESEAQALYEALNVVIQDGRSGYSKSIKTDNDMIELSCTKSKIPGGLTYGCTLHITEEN